MAHPSHLPRFAPARVLLANYHDDTNRALRRILGMWGVDVTVVTSGGDAVAELERAAGGGAAYPVLIARIGLPDCDGRELARQYAPRHPRTAFVALTGNTLDADLRMNREAGFAETLGMPAMAESIHAVLARYLPIAPAEPTA